MTPGPVWILGAGPGIGLAAAHRFQQEGHAVGLVVRPGEDRIPFRNRLGEKALWIEADVFDPLALGEALDGLEQGLGPATVLLYNASTGSPGAWSDLDPKAVASTLAGAASSLLTAVHRVCPAMHRVGHGTILVTGGGLAFEPKPQAGLAAAVKALQRSMALGLAQELEPEGIHVATLAVCGFVQPNQPLSPEAVASALYALTQEPSGAWSRELRIP